MKANIITAVIFIALCWAMYAAARPPTMAVAGTPQTIKVHRNIVDGDIWLVYRMGGTEHHIRASAINAVVWAGSRNTVIFDGGRLNNTISVAEYERVAAEFARLDGAKTDER